MPDDQRLLVTVALGVTLPVTDFGNVKPMVTIANIDPAGDVALQIKTALNTAERAFVEIDGHLDQVLSEILSPVTGRPGFKARLETMEAKMASLETVKKNVRRIADKLKEVDAVVGDLASKKIAGARDGSQKE
jgi:hypothetical protein